MIKNIIFDGSGVIYSRSEKFLEFKRKFSELCGFSSRDDFLNEWRRCKYDQGSCRPPLKSHIISTCKSLGIALTDENAEMLTKEYIRGKTLDLQDKTGGVLSQLSGFKLYILSDATVNSAVKQDIINCIGLSNFFSGVFTSLDFGNSKANPACFKKFCEVTGIKPEESIFVGHKNHEMVGAKLAGLRTVSICRTVLADHNIDSLKELPDILKNI